MKRVWRFPVDVCALALLFFPLSVAFGAAPGWTQVDSFLVGAVNHMTGPTALSGQLRKNGYDLAAEEVNAAGGIQGLPVKVLY